MKTALATLLLALAATPGLSAGDPWIGTWVLDTERSSRRADPSPYKRVTIRIGMDDQDLLRVTYDMVGTRGGVTHREWTGRFDGRDYPMHGLDMVMTNAYRRLDDRRYEILVKLDGVPVARAVAAVSADGGTMEVVTTERDAEGREVRSTAVYRRIRAPVALGNRGDSWRPAAPPGWGSGWGLLPRIVRTHPAKRAVQQPPGVGLHEIELHLQPHPVHRSGET